MRLSRALLLLAVGMTAFAPSPAGAGCGPPDLNAIPDAARAGERITIRGDFWVDGCQDAGSCNACGRCDYGPEPQPMRDIDLEIGGHRVGMVDADQDGSFTVRVTVPDLPPGVYPLSGAFYDDGYGMPTFRVLADRSGASS